MINVNFNSQLVLVSEMKVLLWKKRLQTRSLKRVIRHVSHMKCLFYPIKIILNLSAFLHD